MAKRRMPKSKKSFYKTSKKTNRLNQVPRGGFRL